MTLLSNVDTLVDGLPVREDGSPFPFALFRENGTSFADTITELVGDLIDGYSDIPLGPDSDEDAFNARVDAAVSHANLAQTLLALNGTGEGHFDPANESEETLTAIFHDREIPLVGIPQWTHRVPLVLVSTNYSPYSETEAITGNVQYIDPFSERTLLETLSALGVVEFSELPDIDDAELVEDF